MQTATVEGSPDLASKLTPFTGPLWASKMLTEGGMLAADMSSLAHHQGEPRAISQGPAPPATSEHWHHPDQLIESLAPPIPAPDSFTAPARRRAEPRQGFTRSAAMGLTFLNTMEQPKQGAKQGYAQGHPDPSGFGLEHDGGPRPGLRPSWQTYKSMATGVAMKAALGPDEPRGQPHEKRGA
nr:hypothetical protein Iba_chr08cCG5920 [Ipomoea batatas]